jgi:GNAT superfamily N-acetyltransferase
MMSSTTIAIRRARADEAGLLSDLAFRSKAYWGYPIDWLERWRPELTVDPQALVAAPTFVAVAEASLLGFYHLKPTSRADACELDFLFVEPTAIGRGVGQALFEHACTTARGLGYRSMVWGSDPHADGFYLRMGARTIGARRSSTMSGRATAEMEMAL